MNAGQSGAYRSSELKFQMQLMGTVAEIYCQEYLKSIFEEYKKDNEYDVIRYDDVRTDGFKSPENEYDIRIINKNSSLYYNVESRSSIAHNRDFETALKQFDIIGPYTSVVKHEEKLNDFYLRPLYEYTAASNYLPSNFEKHLKNKEIKLYIVAGCSKEDMIKKGYDKSMNQSNTNYRVVKITNAFDAVQFKTLISTMLK
jgi:hypothetical protein